MDKEEAIRKVLEQRVDTLRAFLERHPEASRGYYDGEMNGYRQALDLLSDDVESNIVELDDTNNF